MSDKISIIFNEFENKRIFIFDEFFIINRFYFETHFIFRVANNENCIVDDKIKTISILLQLNVQCSTLINWIETNFRQ